MNQFRQGKSQPKSMSELHANLASFILHEVRAELSDFPRGRVPAQRIPGPSPVGLQVPQGIKRVKADLGTVAKEMKFLHVSTPHYSAITSLCG